MDRLTSLNILVPHHLIDNKEHVPGTCQWYLPERWKYAVPQMSAEKSPPLVRALMVMTGELVEEVQRQGEVVQQMRDDEKAKRKFKSGKMNA